MDHKLRSVNTKFWVDPWSEELDPKDKLLFLYLLTNTHTNMLGIYEISEKKILFETGLTLKELRKAFKGFESVKKVFYVNNYVVLVNFLKNQNLNTNMKKSALKLFENLPDSLKNELSINHSEGFESLSNGLVILRKIESEIESEIEVEKEKANESLEARKLAFQNSVFEKFSDKYDSDVLQKFINYWTEHGERARKMRFEKEGTFGIGQRLSTWYSLTKKWENEKNKSNKGTFNTSQGVGENFGKF